MPSKNYTSRFIKTTYNLERREYSLRHNLRLLDETGLKHMLNFAGTHTVQWTSGVIMCQQF